MKKVYAREDKNNRKETKKDDPQSVIRSGDRPFTIHYPPNQKLLG